LKVKKAYATYVGRTHDTADLLHRVKIGTQTAVHGEDLLVDDSGDRQAVEAVGERLPQLDVVAPLALVVEAVDTVDGCALVVAAENEEVLRVLDLVREEQADCLQRLLATVHVVAEEQVVRLGWETAVLEEAQQVVVLSVNITADLVWLLVKRSFNAQAQIRTLIGASSSRRMGCEMKISRDFVHRYLISVSSSCTCLPGLLPRTSRRRSMMLSRSTSFWSAMIGDGGR